MYIQQTHFVKNEYWKRVTALPKKKSGMIVFSLTSLVFILLLILRPVIWKILTFSDINVFEFYIFFFCRSLQWTLLLLYGAYYNTLKCTRVCSIFDTHRYFLSLREFGRLSALKNCYPCLTVGVRICPYHHLAFYSYIIIASCIYQTINVPYFHALW